MVFSPSPSPLSSRAPSPAPSFSDEKDGAAIYEVGTQPMEAYQTTLAPWRAAVRSRIVARVAEESKTIARLQSVIRTPWLDSYFVYTSSLGTHTFFMTMLPGLVFFGYADIGLELTIILALGVYLASFFKDLFCSPRPFAPPVTRLTIGTHHLEYGFPSTHSTNSVSIALIFFAKVYLAAHAEEPSISMQTFWMLLAGLLFYTFSIVFGRIYTAMHSFTDCVMGVSLGTFIWWAWSSFPGIPLGGIMLARGLGVGKVVDDWVTSGGLEVPVILSSILLLAVNQHPQPADDCPCFEDAIAFGSVMLGLFIGKWGVSYWGIDQYHRAAVVQPGSGWIYDNATEEWMVVERGVHDITLWWSVAVLKMVIGISVIIIWRILAKSLLHITLPPMYRFLAKAFELPNRRFYTPATDYKNVPSEFANGNGLRAIPSVIDLSGMLEQENGGGDVGYVSGVGYNHAGKRMGQTLKPRNEKVRFASGLSKSYTPQEEEKDQRDDEKEEEVKHYDADVLTKVVVYAGIALLATQVLPVMFDMVGLGVRSWIEV
ncbi:hypothetical protein CYLTODRAFT_421694 [Cylindrobasidium torrendii FP15055 ss-10]|uniref:Phosphatidic acid phosphatase type 2/haloperoxidase domain-containing protein n=1 Tax=Cylindrobasidium torrendii FP15055 ss-10 TaxID=1314674 RepID=A0A0D7BD03_9AGAR|nr:hypothetical protein CYLTODRAFT_421694 [Cylindrobasidium torrendii FP15055 ss-10]